MSFSVASTGFIDAETVDLELLLVEIFFGVLENQNLSLHLIKSKQKEIAEKNKRNLINLKNNRQANLNEFDTVEFMKVMRAAPSYRWLHGRFVFSLEKLAEKLFFVFRWHSWNNIQYKTNRID